MPDAKDPLQPIVPDAIANAVPLTPAEVLDVLEKVVVTDKQAEKALDRQIVRHAMQAPFNLDTVKDLVTVGKYARVAGIKDLIRGSVIEVQRLALVAFAERTEKARALEKKGPYKYIDQIERLTAGNAEFLKIITLSNKILLDCEGTLARLPDPKDPNRDEPINQSFKPGQQILAQNVHIHSQPEQPAKK